MDASVVRVVRLALGVLADRLLTVLALFMTFALACWAMSDPEYARMGVGGFFAIFVFVPCLFKERKRNESPERQDQP